MYAHKVFPERQQRDVMLVRQIFVNAGRLRNATIQWHVSEQIFPSEECKK